MKTRYKKRIIALTGLFAAVFSAYPATEKIEIKSPRLCMKLEVDTAYGAYLASLNTPAAPEAFRLAGEQSLFEIKLRERKGNGSVLHSIGSRTGWQRVEVRKHRGLYQLVFSGYKEIPGAQKLSVSICLAPPVNGKPVWYESAAIRVSWAACVIPENLSLENATLLPLSFRNLSSRTKAFYPYSSGIVCTPKGERSDVKIRYPAGFGASMPWFALWDADRNGLYIGAHDRDATTKDLRFASDSTGGLSFCFSYPATSAGQSRPAFAPCEIVLSGFTGDWFDAAMLYKEWVKKEASWYPRAQMGPDGRKDTPGWMKELCVWAMGSDNRVEQFREALGVPVGFHWYRWHEIPFDNDYPHYFPPMPGFAGRVKELQEKGIYVMPYINGRLWDSRDRGTADSLFTKEALPDVTKKADGTPILESYGSLENDGTDVKFGVMCPATDGWKNKLKEIVLRLTSPAGTVPGTDSYGVKGVYIDQIAAAPPVACFDPRHPHPAGGGDWWTPGYRHILSDLRKSKPEGTILTTESNADGYADGFDGFLVWQFQHNNQVPAFAAVYGGVIQLFGRNYTGDSSTLASKMKLAQSFVFGEQLGWIDTAVLQDKELLAFMKKLVALRYGFRAYFYKGEMGRSPLLTGNNPVFKVQWPFTGVMYDVENAAVQCGAWRIPGEHKTLLMFANYSDRQVRLDVAYPLRDWGIVSGKYTICRHNPDGSAVPWSSLPESMLFGPGEAFVIELQAE